jgi:hypothetical protein
MLKIMLALGCLVASWVSTAALNAPVINYDESVSGDLPQVTCPPNCVAPPSIGTLGIGTNTVSGSIFQSQGSDFFVNGFDLDDFSFVVPSGARLEAITYAFSVSTTTSLIGAGLPYQLHKDPVVPLTSQVVDIAAEVSPVSIFGDVLPLGDGEYFFRHAGVSLFCDPVPCRWDVNYTWSLVVSQVPEPSSLSIPTLPREGLAVLALLVVAAGLWRLRHDS